MLVSPCVACGLNKGKKSPKMEPTGKGKTGVLFFGEAPGKTEDIEGRQFVGKAGKRLRRYIMDERYEPDEDFYFYNSCNCRPVDSEGKNRTPTDKEIGYCQNQVVPKILELKPKVILSLGGTPLKIFCNNHMSSEHKKTISEVRGLLFANQQFNCWIVPTFHPSYLDRNPDDIELEKMFLRDFRLAMGLVKERKGLEDRLQISKQFRYDTDRNSIYQFFDMICGDKKQKKVCIDYETTGLSPYERESKVVCASISDGINTIAFMVEDYIEMLSFFLGASYLDKIAQNASFEDNWSRRLLEEVNKDVNKFIPFSQDTMIKSFILNGRVGINNLELLIWRYFGVKYKEEVDVTKMDSEDERKALKRNAQDAFYTFWLNEFQDRELDDDRSQ